jgi:hypothetical protein
MNSPFSGGKKRKKKIPKEVQILDLMDKDF